MSKWQIVLTIQIQRISVCLILGENQNEKWKKKLSILGEVLKLGTLIKFQVCKAEEVIGERVK